MDESLCEHPDCEQLAEGQVGDLFLCGPHGDQVLAAADAEGTHIEWTTGTMLPAIPSPTVAPGCALPNRRLTYEHLLKPGSYVVQSFAGTLLGTVLRTGRQSKPWSIADQDGYTLGGNFDTRAAAGEALFQVTEDRARAARDADLGRAPEADVRAAALALLARLDHTTTEAFALGAEKPEREALRTALGYGDGYSDPPAPRVTPEGSEWSIHLLQNSECITVVLTAADGSCGEFSIAWIDVEGELSARLECFADGWPTLAMSGVADLMATWPVGITRAEAFGRLTMAFAS